MKTITRKIIFLFLICYADAGFAQVTKKDSIVRPDTGNIKVLELRNYLVRPGKRDEFINYFEEVLIEPQEVMGVKILGQYRVKGSPDNFFWMRGFKDMNSRKKFLNDFYYGSFWKQHRAIPNSLLLNNDNVYLLKPLNLKDSLSSDDGRLDVQWFRQDKGIAVIDFFISNTKLDKLIPFVKDKYLSILKASGIENSSFWVSESIANDFLALPVFQDKNLLVQISFYKDEVAYKAKMKLLDSKMNEDLKTDMADLVTVKNTLIIYPTKRLLQK